MMSDPRCNGIQSSPKGDFWRFAPCIIFLQIRPLYNHLHAAQLDLNSYIPPTIVFFSLTEMFVPRRKILSAARGFLIGFTLSIAVFMVAFPERKITFQNVPTERRDGRAVKDIESDYVGDNEEIVDTHGENKDDKMKKMKGVVNVEKDEDEMTEDEKQNMDAHYKMEEEKEEKDEEEEAEEENNQEKGENKGEWVTFSADEALTLRLKPVQKLRILLAFLL